TTSTARHSSARSTAFTCDPPVFLVEAGTTLSRDTRQGSTDPVFPRSPALFTTERPREAATVAQGRHEEVGPAGAILTVLCPLEDQLLRWGHRSRARGELELEADELSEAHRDAAWQ